MAITTYQCSECKRQIGKQDNLLGLTVFGKCIITDGCLGQLYRIGRNIDNKRETFPSEVEGLIDYVPRKAFSPYTQTILASSWMIQHNLSTSPAVSVYVNDSHNNLVRLDPEQFSIIIVDKNTINLIFQQSFTGVAQCISRSTTLTQDVIAMPSTLTKISNNGVITMAVSQTIINSPPLPNTIMDNLRFNFEMIVTEPSQIAQSSIENIGTVSIGSSWDDWTKILIAKRKNYLVRTKSVLSFLVFGTKTLASDIPNGTRIQFNRIQFPNDVLRAINSRELLFLLSNPPYASIDKVKDKLIDVGEMIDTNINYFVYMNGDLYVDSTIIETSYPSTIRV